MRTDISKKLMIFESDKKKAGKRLNLKRIRGYDLEKEGGGSRIGKF